MFRSRRVWPAPTDPHTATDTLSRYGVDIACEPHVRVGTEDLLLRLLGELAGHPVRSRRNGNQPRGRAVGLTERFGNLDDRAQVGAVSTEPSWRHQPEKPSLCKRFHDHVR